MSESQDSSSVPGDTKRGKVRSRSSSEDDADADPERCGRCGAAAAPDEEPESEQQSEFQLPAHWVLPQLTQDMRLQEEQSRRGAADGWASCFRPEAAAPLPVWRAFWAFAQPRAALLLSSKLYLCNDACFRHLLASFLASALWFAGGPWRLHGAMDLDGYGCSGSADFVFSSRNGVVVLIVGVRRSDWSYHQNVRQLWMQMFEAWRVNRCRGGAAAAAAAVVGVLQDQAGAVAFRLEAECPAAAGGGAAGTAAALTTPAADPPAAATQTEAPRGSAGDQAEAGRQPAGSRSEAGISCSDYMCVFYSDGRPGSGMGAWSTLLLTTLSPECRAWSEEQAGVHVAQLEERAKREHCSFMRQLEHV